jgi:lipopolysaccharide/colanic/teichoic acid biosynthesis glycosyltransferase
MDFVIINQPRVFPHRIIYQYAKRAFDVTLSILSLPFALPIMAICALAIHFDSAGPSFFVQDRIGKGGRNFRMIKFRTMKSHFDDRQNQAYMKAYIKGALGCNEDGKEVYKPIRDDQITRVGRILRKSSLDELPQIFNVLKGEMSWIGPRPNVPWEVEEYRPWHYERCEVLPGITGLAQVCGRSCLGFVSLVRLDIEYIEKQSLAMDLKIIWLTFLTVFRGIGAK